MTASPERQAILRSDSGHVMGIFSGSYEPPPYAEWLIGTIARLLDDLSIGSAGLLRGGAVAWVSVEVPENITAPEGVEFRPHLFGATSFDGSLATTTGWRPGPAPAGACSRPSTPTPTTSRPSTAPAGPSATSYEP
ncbi:DUF932 domain-containing protein [Streptosporangium roseum]|uniref:DUF932 domain-containing protein n=1 Tax=Streptosporangium roseum TaxID=2001 RepID=UPI000A52CF32|nr:DUF932 domain-containing protein [Streptosporangium roseum]